MDSRHKPTNDDILMCNWIKYYGYDLSVVATKSDKLKEVNLKEWKNYKRYFGFIKRQ